MATQPPAPAPLETHHVFLDTEVYREMGHNPDSPPLKTLEDRLAADDLVLHTTDITLAEVRRQLWEYVDETASAMRKACRKLGVWRKRIPEIVTSDLAAFDADKVAQAAFDKFHRAATERWKAINHLATDVAAFDVFKDYFERKPPFAKPGSKEFPDAFVIKALEAWCRDNQTRMYVVTKDGGMTDAVKASDVLLPMASLTDLLTAQASTETPDARDIAQKLLDDPDVQSQIEASISENIEELIPIYNGDEYCEGEVSDHELQGTPEIEDFNVIAASRDELSLIVSLKTPLLVQLDYVDFSMAMYDHEDEVYIGTEIGHAEIEDDPVIRVFCKIARKARKVSGLKMLTSEIYVSEPYDNYK